MLGLGPAALLALGIWALPACDCSNAPPQQAAATWPEGTAIAIDDVPISSAEIDQASIHFQRIEPASSETQLRRLALTNIVLPRTLARLKAPDAHAQAKQRAQETLAQLRSGGLAGPPDPDGTTGERLEGTWQDLGIEVWGSAIELEEGAWSEPLEQPGYFVLVRRLELTEGPVPMATRVKLDALVFRWLEGAQLQQDIEAEHDRHRMTIVDPRWSSIVPELLQYRMGVHRP